MKGMLSEQELRSEWLRLSMMKERGQISPRLYDQALETIGLNPRVADMSQEIKRASGLKRFMDMTAGSPSGGGSSGRGGGSAQPVPMVQDPFLGPSNRGQTGRPSDFASAAGGSGPRGAALPPSYNPANYTQPYRMPDGRISEGDYVGPNAERPRNSTTRSAGIELPAVARPSSSGGRGGELMPDGTVVNPVPASDSRERHAEMVRQQQEAAKAKQDAAKAKATTPSSGPVQQQPAGGGGSRGSYSGPDKIRERQQDLAERKQKFAEQEAEKNRKEREKKANKPSGGGRGGGGGGGGKKREPTARELERQMDNKNRATERANARADRRQNDINAREEGFKDHADKMRHEERQNFFKESRDRSAAEKLRQEEMRKNASGEAKSYEERMEAAKKERSDNITAEQMWNTYNQGLGEIQMGSDGKMRVDGKVVTHKFGNKHAGMTRARGDLA